MGIKGIATKAKEGTLGFLIDKAVEYVHKDPQKNFDKLMENLLKLEKMFPASKGAFSKFMNWVNANPGSKQWFIELLSRDVHQVKTFMRNMFVNVSLKWMERNEKTEEKYGITAPYTILISPTMRCNLRCRGCYAGMYTMNDDLSIELVDRVITEGKELGTHFYTILGGEPFVRFNEMYEIFKKHNDCLFQVFTNGTLITDSVADKLQEVGNVVVAFSVNGDEKETEYMRGPGVYQKVLASMERMKARNLMFGMSLVLTRHNFEIMTNPDFYKEWRERGVVYAWNFLFMPVGKDPVTSLMPTPEQRYEYGKFIQKFRNEYPFYIMDFWSDAPYVHGCIAGGRRYAHINHKGDVEPCIFAHFATDNIKNKSLVEALRSPFFADIRAHQPHTDNLLRPCMIIDNPSVLRNVVKKHNAKPTHDGAEKIITDLAPVLDEYSKHAAEYLDPIWKKDWQKSINDMKERQASYGEGLDRIEYRLNPDRFMEKMEKLSKNDPEFAKLMIEMFKEVAKEYGTDEDRQKVLIEK
jgi:MoaA/NifB/PqqE/SkfB family radical SAM enzyme